MRWPWTRDTEPAIQESLPPATEPAGMPNLWDKAERPQWTRLVNSPEWQRDMRPWFEALLVNRLAELLHAEPGMQTEILKHECRLLKQLINQPDVEIRKLQEQLNRRYEGGLMDAPEPASRNERVSSNGR